LKGGASNLNIDPQSIPSGANNEIIRNVSFMFGMTAYSIAYMRLADATKQRYEIPDFALSAPSFNPTMRLEQLGF
jgi:hypothetical protein